MNYTGLTQILFSDKLVPTLREHSKDIIATTKRVGHVIYETFGQTVKEYRLTTATIVVDPVLPFVLEPLGRLLRSNPNAVAAYIGVSVASIVLSYIHEESENWFKKEIGLE